MTAETVEIPGYIAGTWDIDPVPAPAKPTTPVAIGQPEASATS